jgi:hypothetical protein
MTLSGILPPRSWRRRLVIAIVVLLVVYSVVGFLVIPVIARARMEALLADYVGKPVKVGGLRFNPFALSVAVDDFEISDDQGPPILSFAELSANLRALDLIRFDVALDSIHLEAPRVRLVLDNEGNLNLAQLFAGERTTPEPEPPEEAEDEGLFPVSVTSITIVKGQLIFRDEAPAEPFELVLDPVQLELLEFDTRRDHKGTHVISANAGDHATLRWTGNISVDPLHAEGEITLDRIDAPTLVSYLREALPFVATKGLLKVQAQYVYDGAAASFVLGPGEVDVQTLELRESKDGPPFLTLQQLHVAGANVDFDKRSVAVAGLTSKKAQATAWLGAEGALGPIPSSVSPLRVATRQRRRQTTMPTAPGPSPWARSRSTNTPSHSRTAPWRSRSCSTSHRSPSTSTS